MMKRSLIQQRTIFILKKIVLFLFIFHLWAWFNSPVEAIIRIGESLEWMVVDTPLIIKGVVVDVKQYLNPKSPQPLWLLEEVSVEIKEVLKGDYHDQPITFRRIHTGYETAKIWLESKSEMVFFLTRNSPPLMAGMEEMGLQRS